MNLANVTHTTLTRDLGQEVPEAYVVVAKHQAAGVGNESIAEIIGCEVVDITTMESDPLFRTVRQTIGAQVASQHADQPMLVDALESIALRRLVDRIETERDPDFLLKVAATANRMSRRSKPHGDALDPARVGGKAAITLTTRMIERITNSGHRQVAEERILSISDGSMANPSFDEVDKLLSIKAAGLGSISVPVQEEQTLMERLNEEMEKRL